MNCLVKEFFALLCILMVFSSQLTFAQQGGMAVTAKTVTIPAPKAGEDVKLTDAQVFAGIEAIEGRLPVGSMDRAGFNTALVDALKQVQPRVATERVVQEFLGKFFSQEEVNSLKVEKLDYNVSDVHIKKTLTPDDRQLKLEQGYRIFTHWATAPVGKPIQGKEGFAGAYSSIIPQIERLRDGGTGYSDKYISAFKAAFDRCVEPSNKYWAAGWCEIREPGSVWQWSRGGEGTSNHSYIYEPVSGQHGKALFAFAPEVGMIIGFGENCGGNPIVEEQKHDYVIEANSLSCLITANTQSSPDRPVEFFTPEEVVTFTAAVSGNIPVLGSWSLAGKPLNKNGMTVTVKGSEVGVISSPVDVMFTAKTTELKDQYGKPYQVSCKLPVISRIKPAPRTPSCTLEGVTPRTVSRLTESVSIAVNVNNPDKVPVILQSLVNERLVKKENAAPFEGRYAYSFTPDQFGIFSDENVVKVEMLDADGKLIQRCPGDLANATFSVKLKCPECEDLHLSEVKQNVSSKDAGFAPYVFTTDIHRSDVASVTYAADFSWLSEPTIKRSLLVEKIDEQNARFVINRGHMPENAKGPLPGEYKMVVRATITKKNGEVCSEVVCERVFERGSGKSHHCPTLVCAIGIPVAAGLLICALAGCFSGGGVTAIKTTPAPPSGGGPSIRSPK